MKYSGLVIKRSGAVRIAAAMSAGSIFTALYIDGYSLYMNSGWMCIVLGSLIALPFISAVKKLGKKDPDSYIWRTLCIVIALYMAHTAAGITRLLINSVSYSNLQTVSPVLLSAIMLLACLYVNMKNASGLANAVKVCGIAFLLLLSIILVSNLGHMNYRWLRPFGAADAGTLYRGSIYVAGSVTAAALIHMIAGEDDSSGGVLRGSIIGALIALVLSVYTSVMSPVDIASVHSRLQNIEMLISNGRTSLGVQLPITLAWFLGYLLVLTSYCYSAALFMQNALRGQRPVVPSVMSAIAVFVFANCGLAESEGLEVVGRYAFYGAVLIIMTACMFGRRKHEKIT